MSGARAQILGCWVLALAACSPGDSKPSPTAPAQEVAPDPAPSPVMKDDVSAPSIELVGVLHEGGVQVCNEAYESFWVDRLWAVGFVPLVHESTIADALARLEGKVVKVSGDESDAPATTHGGDPRPEKPVPCPEPQMRSDWEQWPRGTRQRRGPRPLQGTLRVRAVEAVEPVRGEVRDDEVWLSVTNPFGRAVADASVVAHYEGCYGKPGTATQRRPLGAIEPGATIDDIPVPVFVTREMPRGNQHRLHSVQIVATLEGAVFDLDVPVKLLGLDIECPKRK